MREFSFDAAVNTIVCSILDRLDALDSRLRFIEGKLNRILGMELGEARRDIMASKSFERLAQEVTENRDAVASVEALIVNLAQQMRDAAGDEEAINKLADELDANTGRLSKAVADNTPFTPSGQ